MDHHHPMNILDQQLLLTFSSSCVQISFSRRNWGDSYHVCAWSGLHRDPKPCAFQHLALSAGCFSLPEQPLLVSFQLFFFIFHAPSKFLRIIYRPHERCWISSLRRRRSLIWIICFHQPKCAAITPRWSESKILRKTRMNFLVVEPFCDPVAANLLQSSTLCVCLSHRNGFVSVMRHHFGGVLIRFATTLFFFAGFPSASFSSGSFDLFLFCFEGPTVGPCAFDSSAVPITVSSPLSF